MKVVRFLKPAGIYNGGEIAGFPDDEAQALIAAGAAGEYQAPQAKAETPGPDAGAAEVITLDQAKAELAAKTKAELVTIGKQYGLDLSERATKEDLIAGILSKAVKA